MWWTPKPARQSGYSGLSVEFGSPRGKRSARANVDKGGLSHTATDSSLPILQFSKQILHEKVGRSGVEALEGLGNLPLHKEHWFAQPSLWTGGWRWPRCVFSAQRHQARMLLFHSVEEPCSASSRRVDSDHLAVRGQCHLVRVIVNSKVWPEDGCTLPMTSFRSVTVR